MNRPVRVAILGAGRWGHHLIRLFSTLPGVQLKAVVDPKIHGLARGEQFRSLPTTVQYLADWQQALEIKELNTVVVATPAATHYSVTAAALERGLHVLLEKPMTLTAETCEDLCQLAQRKRLQLVVDHTYLFHPAIRRGKGAIASNQLGHLRYGYAIRTGLGPIRRDIDSLWDLAIHDIAIFNHWLGQRPVQVSASGSSWLLPQPCSGFPQGLADMGWIHLVYPSGFQATIHVSWLNAHRQRRILVSGERGSLVFDDMDSPALMCHRGEIVFADGTFSPTPTVATPIPFKPVEPLRQVCEHFIHCVRFQHPSDISPGWLGRDLVKVQEKIAVALNTNKPQELPWEDRGIGEWEGGISPSF